MGASPLMSLGIKAMNANYAGLQTTGHNIANANVSGYSRQQAELATSEGQFTGAGFFGRGVDVISVSRSHNEFLTREAASARSLAAMDASRLGQLQRLETIFQPGEAGLGNATSQFMTSLVDLANQPADLSARQVVLARANDLAGRFNEAGVALDGAQASVHSELRSAVSEVNALAKSIAEANQRVASMRGLGQPANDILDERDRLISRLSTHVSLTRMEAEDGSMALFIGGGQRLVLGTKAAQLKVLQDDSDGSRAAIGLSEAGAVLKLNGSSIGGSIGGLLRYQNEDLVDARNLIGRLAASVGGAINEQQLKGVSLKPPLGQVASLPLFDFGAPQALPHVANARDGSGNPIGAVGLTITDPSGLQASEYDLREDNPGSGSWVLTRLSDGQVTAVSDGDVVDGMRIDLSSNPPQGGDRYLLQPVSRAANGMVALLGDPRDLAAASPVVATVGPANTGTASVASLQATVAPLPQPDGTARISFISDSGDYIWELFDSSNTLLASGADTWQAGQTIPPTGQDINGFSLQLSGVPRNGDIVNVESLSPTAISNNNGNALALMGLRDAAISGGRTATDAWSYAMSDIGVRVQSGKASSTISQAVASQTEVSRSAESGVNLDEEAARLIQYQQSYQAAAKILQVAQSLFDNLLELAGR
jgi:flagellar hook-associated protein 1